MSEFVRVERDMRGRLRVAGPRRQELLCDLLETDVRDYVPYINALTEAISACQAGRPKTATLVGNVYELSIGEENATIRNIHDENVPTSTVPVAELEAYVTAWRAAVDDKPVDDPDQTH